MKFLAIGLVFAAQCVLWCALGWLTRRHLRSRNRTANPARIDISDVTGLERWIGLSSRIEGYILLVPLGAALLCWSHGNRWGMWMAIGALFLLPVIFAGWKLHSRVLAWVIVGCWMLASLYGVSLVALSSDALADRLFSVLNINFLVSILFSPLLAWSWPVLILWYSRDPGSEAFRLVKTQIDTPENIGDRGLREDRRWESKEKSAERTVLSGAAAMQSLLGFASLLTGSNVIQIALQKTAQATRERALQLGAVSGSAMLDKDGKALVLYLRSFADDGLYFTTWFEGRITWEQPIVRAGLLVGPVIAIGQPGDELPKLGAARDYLSDDEWQAHAQQWMAVAQAIVLVVGETRGLAWEATELLTRQLLEKTVLIMPPLSDAEMAQRWKNFIANLDATGPYAEIAKLDLRYTLAVIFDETGRPSSIYSTCRSQTTDYYWAMKTALGLIRQRAAGKEPAAMPAL